MLFYIYLHTYFFIQMEINGKTITIDYIQGCHSCKGVSWKDFPFLKDVIVKVQNVIYFTSWPSLVFTLALKLVEMNQVNIFHFKGTLISTPSALQTWL